MFKLIRFGDSGAGDGVVHESRLEQIDWANERAVNKWFLAQISCDPLNDTVQAELIAQGRKLGDPNFDPEKFVAEARARRKAIHGTTTVQSEEQPDQPGVTKTK